MTESHNVASLSILGKTYKVKCPNDKIGELRESAQYLERKIRELHQSSHNALLGADRLMVITSLNIVHELLEQKKQASSYMDVMSAHIHQLQQKIDNALAIEAKKDTALDAAAGS